MKFFLRLTALTLLIALFSTSVNYSQNLETIQKKFDEYFEKKTLLKLHLELDKPKYSLGDTILFSAWYLSENNFFVEGNHVGSVVLQNCDGQIVAQSFFKIKSGKAVGHIILDKSITPNEYLISAFTYRTRQLGPDFVFTKKILVESRKKLKSEVHEELLRFYAEGGNLVADVENTVVVVGKPNSHAFLYESGGSTIQIKIVLDSSGIARISFLPKNGVSYLIQYEGQGSKPVPIGVLGTNKVSVTIKSSSNSCHISFRISKNSNLATRDLVAVITSNGKLVAKKRISWNDLLTDSWEVTPSSHIAQLCQLHVIDTSGELLAQRVFVPFPIGSIREPITSNDRVDILQREKGTLTTLFKDAFGSNLSGILTVKSINSGLCEDVIGYQNRYYFIDFPDVEELLHPFSSKDPAYVNDFLITKQWKRINWKEIMSESVIRRTHKEISGFHALVISRKTGLPAKDSTRVTTFLQKNGKGLEVYTKDGKIELPFVVDFWGKDKLFCSVISNSAEKFLIRQISDSLAIPMPCYNAEEINDPSMYGNYQFNRNLIHSSFTAFKDSQVPNSLALNPNSFLEDEFNGADYSVKIDEYKVFQNMKELITEIVPFVQVKKRDSTHSVRISFRGETLIRRYQQDPLYIVDGMLTRNTDFVMSLLPSDVSHIKLINHPNKLTRLGSLGEGAILFIQTKNQQYDLQVLEAESFPVTGYGLWKTDFTNEDERKASSRIPDLRSSLGFWPNLRIGKSGTSQIAFTGSDDVGTHAFKFILLTDDGIPYLLEKKVTVRFDSNRD